MIKHIPKSVKVLVKRILIFLGLRKHGVLIPSFPLVRVNPKSFQIGGSWLNNGEAYDSTLIRIVFEILECLVEKNDQDVNFIDIGASTGTFSLLPVFDKRINVFAFEPNSSVFELLTNNVKINNITENCTFI